MKSGICATVLLVTALLGAGALNGCSQPSPTAQPEPVSSGEERAERDPDVLKLLYGRAAVTLNPHLATGYQDFEAARIVYEPLASYSAKGELVPFLAAEIPTEENGGIAADGKSVTWKLRPEVTWTDGKPFTADDVVFTFEFIRNPQVAAATAQFYEGVESVEAVDSNTVKITFTEPTAAWSVPFTGQTGLILPRHVFEEFNGPKAREAQVNVQPIGTGPYTVLAFAPGTVIYSPNVTYWGGAPAFRSIELTGGIAPYAAARDVMRTGNADLANNIQVEASALKDLEKDAQGRLITTFGSSVERIMLNFSHPFAKTEKGERSSSEVPHPYFSDIRVREAINLAVDRDAIAQTLYGGTGRPVAQLLVEPAQYATSTIPYEYDLERAKSLLDAAGWVDTNDNGIRDKGGVEMEVLFQSAVNPVRQQTQAMVQKSLEELGMKVQIERVRVDDFFSANPQQTNSLNHFFADMQVYSTGSESPDPTTYMSWWTCGKIASQANKWQEPNNARYCNPEYDQLWEAASKELDPEKRAALFKQMDELLAMDVAVIPIVHRAIANAVSNTLTGLEPTPWDASTWDIKNWQRASEAPES
ncbi:peptide ABC transporter substrate-binding protein [Pseudanabaena sp. FACHB-2040]|uniref:peptide ABC transporter substrate-binding protein n=1 Tax=Pseudanabaena sp. FACHB-2040 TaxID=2692859 RepID=UPI001681D8A0|nr:peptide ABC transporter substrate-binding protein [Pseudanabaena sp. FACHB-2040]MBD2260386.1 peptide ABC transporter substrate-binding protein [Pseudanabaena sp. FACHB-2040]